MLSRRSFLKTTAGALAYAGFVQMPLAWAQSLTHQYLIRGYGRKACLIDLLTSNVEFIDLTFDPHSFVRHPEDPDRIWAIKRRDGSYGKALGPVNGDAAAEINIKTKEVLQILTLPQNAEFYGHGIFSPDASTLFISRVDMDTCQGYMTGYDVKDCHKVVVDYPIARGVVHQCCSLADKTAIIASSGIEPGPEKRPYSGARVGPASIIQIDVKNGQLMKKWVVEDEQQMLNHCAVLKDNTLLALSHPRDDATEHGKTYSGKWDQGQLKALSYSTLIDAGSPGECLSIALNEEQNIAVITDPLGANLFVLDLKTGVFIKRYASDAKGVVFDEWNNHFIATGSELTLLDGLGNKLPQSNNTKIIDVSLVGTHSLLL